MLQIIYLSICRRK